MMEKGSRSRFRKGKYIIAIAVAAILAVPFSVYAATSDTTAAKNIRSFFGIDSSRLTDEQKETVKGYSQKLAELQKDFINSMASNGAMTKEQAEKALEKVEENLKNSGESNIIPGFGMGRKAFEGSGKRGGAGFSGIDPAKLTDAQKKQLIDSYKKAAELQKELIGKLVAGNAMTKEKGDAAIKKIDERIADLDKNGLSGNTGILLNGFGPGSFRRFGLAGIDTAGLTDEQKNLVKDAAAKIAEVQKELAGKMLASGAITQEQSDAWVKRIDGMLSSEAKTGLPGKGMMKRSHNGVKGGKGGSTSGSAIQPATGAAIQSTTGTI